MTTAIQLGIEFRVNTGCLFVTIKKKSLTWNLISTSNQFEQLFQFKRFK